MINITDLKTLLLKAKRNRDKPKYFAMSPIAYDKFIMYVLELSPYRVKHPIPGQLEPTVLGVPVRSDPSIIFEAYDLALHTSGETYKLEI